jgi:hypothetical protein
MAGEIVENKIVDLDYKIAIDQLQRFQFACDSGHSEYVDKARRNYRYWRGDGGQWSDADREFAENVQGRKIIEINGILPAVETAVGEQISTRTDICFKPAKGGATAETAAVLSKLIMHDLEANGYPRIEKQVFRNGLIKRRGYIDMRMSFEDNQFGNIVMTDKDPLTIIPDTYSTQYDPNAWPGVMTFDWLTLDEIEGLYGKDARVRAERNYKAYSDTSWSDHFSTSNHIDQRQGFGTNNKNGFLAYWNTDSGELRLRVIERQHWKMSMCLHFVDPKNGDKRLVDQEMSIPEAKEFATNNGLLLQKLNAKRPRWTVTTPFSTLHDDWGPYKSYTLIPFFYLFDYGDTLGMVDNAISPQDLQNKSIVSELAILTMTANSGWQMEEESLVGMTPNDLQDVGMKNGLVLVRKKGAPKPDKIEPNKYPTGMDRLSEKGEAFIKSTTGMNDTEQGLKSASVSGVAQKAKLYQTKLSLADPLDNMEFTRTLIGRKWLELTQQFMTNERIIKITGKDQFGKATEEELIINQRQSDGSILNDITLGEYAVVVSRQPSAATFEESQYQQSMEMREAGIAIPDTVVVANSNLADKQAVIDQMSNQQGNELTPLEQAQLDLLIAKKSREMANTANTNIQALYGATNAARILAADPRVAPLADELALSAGFVDHNAAPIVPQGQAPVSIAGPAPPLNTSPNFPPQADRGVASGIESGRLDTIDMA